MGHSRRTKSVASSGAFKPDLSRDEAQAELSETFQNKEAAKTVDTLCRYTIPVLPNGSAKLPSYEAIRYGGKFLWDVKKHGVKEATKNFTKSYVGGKIAYGVTNAVVEQASDAILDSGANKALANSAEEALSETISSIVLKGADAL